MSAAQVPVFGLLVPGRFDLCINTEVSPTTLFASPPYHSPQYCDNQFPTARFGELGLAHA